MVKLSHEQEKMIQIALLGNNVLVDACIGSGKTTAIQQLCNRVPMQNRILYLTYNKLLKIDAKNKIHRPNSTVSNYHGFAYMCLARIGVKCGVQDLIQEFNRVKPDVSGYDVLIVDEYQDIELEHSIMLQHIKESNPAIQVIMVGDMQQKVYDKTTLNVPSFVDSFLGNYQKLTFTKCFRISKDHAAMLGRIWGKPIHGVNSDCIVQTMSEKNAEEFIAKLAPSTILCLGAISGQSRMANTLNHLERKYPKKFNKHTVYASIEDTDYKLAPPETAAIFTSYDSSKGLERENCFIFDFTIDYWDIRLNKKGQKYDILRNIFCVAASRGKKHIIFVKSNTAMLTERVLSLNDKMQTSFSNVNISEMFDFKYIEDIYDCYRLLSVKKKMKKDTTPINVKTSDGLIDLSPCIGVYQEACFFNQYDIERQFEMYQKTHPDRAEFNFASIEDKSLCYKILKLISLETGQARYVEQVEENFIADEESQLIQERLSKVFKKTDSSQVACSIPFCNDNNKEMVVNEKGISNDGFFALGYADVVKGDTVYELKFVTELQHTHFLQCASYMVALELEKGVLWNVRTNEMYEITIPDRDAFLDCVARTITKHEYKTYCSPRKVKHR